LLENLEREGTIRMNKLRKAYKNGSLELIAKPERREAEELLGEKKNTTDCWKTVKKNGMGIGLARTFATQGKEKQGFM